MEFTEEQIERYSRHIILPEVGGKGQRRLLDAKVLIVGAGGLGSPTGLYLAAAGVGTIGVADSDAVEMSNLQRQLLHSTPDLGRQKCLSAKETMEAINPDVSVVPHDVRLTSANILDIIAGYDVVVDGSDNFPTRYLVNDACVMARKPLSHAGILRFEGQVTTIIPGEGPCYRCLYPDPPPPGLVPSCQEAGILGAVAGVVGTIQAGEVLKLILGIGDTLVGRLLLYNALEVTFREMRIARHSDCPVCGDHPTVTALIDYEEFCSLRGSGSVSEEVTS
ncbi:MAG: molybdopterin-synthase adenylyltransferase MoeB [Armatimonadetes bacterium]|nr:molybdopterin-synthase adenylyltransferase MoeB [Armatimonadota bacterium]